MTLDTTKTKFNGQVTLYDLTKYLILVMLDPVAMATYSSGAAKPEQIIQSKEQGVHVIKIYIKHHHQRIIRQTSSNKGGLNHCIVKTELCI